MDIVTVAIVIVASALGALVAFACERSALPGWVAIGGALLVALLVFAAGPTVLGG